MTVEQRVAQAVRARADTAPAPWVDPELVRRAGRRRLRRRRGAIAAAAASLLAAAIVGGVALDRRTTAEAGPAALGPLDFSDGVRAFVDPTGEVLHVGGATVPLEHVPGLADNGVVTPVGILYVTPEQEVRLIDEAGTQTVLADGLGPPPAGFAPSVAYDDVGTAGAAVVVRLTPDVARTGRALGHAFDLSTGELLASSRLVPMADPTRVVVGGATGGVAFLDYRGAGVLSWVWKGDGPAGEYAPGGRQVVDSHNWVVVIERQPGTERDGAGLVYRTPWGAAPSGSGPGPWRVVAGHEGEQLAPNGGHLVDATWRSWPEGGPVQRPVGPASQAIDVPVPEGSRVSMSYDSDGSVLAAVDGAGHLIVVDCAVGASSCEPVGDLDERGGDPRFLDGAGP